MGDLFLDFYYFLTKGLIEFDPLFSTEKSGIIPTKLSQFNPKRLFIIRWKKGSEYISNRLKELQ